MLIRNWLFSGLLMSLLANSAVAVSSTVESKPQRANLIDAMQHYHKGDFASSYDYLHELMRLGNGQASAQLGMMTLAEEGVSYDPVLAWAYFELAGQLNYPDGSPLAEEVYTQLDVGQQQATLEALAKLKSQLIITHSHAAWYSHSGQMISAPVIAKRTQPRYPRRALTRGQAGVVQMLLLIDTDGSVALAHPYFYSHPEFKRTAERYITQWRYEPTDLPRKTTLNLDFSMSTQGEDARAPYLQVVNDSLWEGAVLGNPFSQTALSVFLGFVTPAEQAKLADASLLANQPPTIRKFNDYAEQGVFPIDWTGNYWLIRAAQAGDPTAQLTLAFRHDEWRDYLISKNDDYVKAWAAVDILSQPPEFHAMGLELLAQLQDSESELIQSILAVITPFYDRDA